ncbi:DUF805 domain-containing protein [Tepidiforma sp.]|jgi:uncharacterized membrane protein YhaH (DUF805 family)|uniref:DUF805 domain-containing protein n=1 Tax=Tepidiforma sp. TaxID=2682230 RepID=UPI002617D6BE|nr:DUF805 domain-containing protein [Tepidiforma sp.]MCX7616646.1 DUF805 domain-containing protein [Tepidiforma sp.]
MQAAAPAQPSPIQWYLTPWKRYVLFEGRAGRPEFWWFALGQFIIGLVLGALAVSSNFFNVVSFAFSLAALLPSIGVTARRLHDIGQSGWLQLIGLIPLVGWIALIVLCAQPSKPMPNQYGEAPLPPAP